MFLLSITSQPKSIHMSQWCSSFRIFFLKTLAWHGVSNSQDHTRQKLLINESEEWGVNLNWQVAFFWNMGKFLPGFLSASPTDCRVQCTWSGARAFVSSVWIIQPHDDNASCQPQLQISFNRHPLESPETCSVALAFYEQND